MPVNYLALNQSRMKWRAYPMAPTPIEIPEAEDVIKRILALAINLELPVGAWVAEATKKEIPISKDAMDLLKANIADETTHDHAVRFALEIYPPDTETLDEAERIAQSWYKAEGHPLEKPALVECGVFMVSLAVLYLCGGQSLFNLANNIATDEQRHVTTNRAILRSLRVDPRRPAHHLEVFRYETLAWMLDGLKLPMFSITSDDLIEASTDLVTTGRSQLLSELTGGAKYTPPFETRNSNLY